MNAFIGESNMSAADQLESALLEFSLGSEKFQGARVSSGFEPLECMQPLFNERMPTPEQLARMEELAVNCASGESRSGSW